MAEKSNVEQSNESTVSKIASNVQQVTERSRDERVTSILAQYSKLDKEEILNKMRQALTKIIELGETNRQQAIRIGELNQRLQQAPWHVRSADYCRNMAERNGVTHFMVESPETGEGKTILNLQETLQWIDGHQFVKGVRVTTFEGPLPQENELDGLLDF